MRGQVTLESNQYRLAKRMRWAARIIGLLISAIFLTMLIGEGIAEIMAEDWKVTNQADLVAGILIGVLGVNRSGWLYRILVAGATCRHTASFNRHWIWYPHRRLCRA